MEILDWCQKVIQDLKCFKNNKCLECQWPDQVNELTCEFEQYVKGKGTWDQHFHLTSMYHMSGYWKDIHIIKFQGWFQDKDPVR
jgi:hypothetical protein